MKRLRKVIRVDNLGTQQRASSAKWGRLVYVGLIIAFFGSLLYYLFGNVVVLSADGIALADIRAVDASYTATIVEVYVKQGDHVEEGAPLMRLESFAMVKEIADLALRDGELAVREGQLRGQLNVIKTVKPLAERNARETTSTVEKFDKVSGRGLVSLTTRDSALQDSLNAAQRLAELSSQEVSIGSELSLVAKSRAQSNRAMEQLKKIYADGNVKAASSGVIGVKVPMPGQVVQLGEQLLQINGNTAYVLAYLPDQYLFQLKTGTAVTIRSGGETAKGRIDSILAVADALPDEFQNLFRPRDRSRLFRVKLEGANPFAVSQKVTVSGCALSFCWVR